MQVIARIVAVIAVACVTALAPGQPPEALAQSLEQAPVQQQVDHPTAPIIIDGNVVFTVPGTSALPASDRADAITGRIIDAAERVSTPPVMTVADTEFGRSVMVDGTEVMIVTELDAEVAGLDIPTTAEAISMAIGTQIEAYRERRSSGGMIRSAIFAVLWTVGILLYFAALFYFGRYARDAIHRYADAKIKAIETSTNRIVRAEVVASAATSALSVIALIMTLLVLYYYLTQVLMSFPATRNLARILLSNFWGPLSALVHAVLAKIPDLVTIAIIAITTRWLINFTWMVFRNIELGRFRISGFERHWVWPTYRIVKVAMILFAVVVAYPYIPGSGTAAFQGVTIFLGVLLSFGSSSVISNLLAGLFVIYRRSVNLGDMIMVSGVLGKIESVRLLETLLRTPKNELVSVPNSQLLGSQLTNYSRYGEGGGLIIHSTVGIGYEEPQRKIEAMLIEAARRTPGLEKTPEPFVLRTSLADFAVNYEINGFARTIENLPKLQSSLNANILDVFNENKVQIMTPAYRADPEVPKIAPADHVAGGATTSEPG